MGNTEAVTSGPQMSDTVTTGVATGFPPNGIIRSTKVALDERSQMGVIGLAVMGSNLARNIESRGYTVSVYNRTGAVTEEFMTNFGGDRFIATEALPDFVQSIARPRKVIIMVKAGYPTDAVIQSVLPLLEPGDILMDGGNADFRDTERRVAACAEKGVLFLGVGISGGEEGALHGPSLMPGGSKEAWQHVEEIFEKIAAMVDGPCVTYIGPGGAGHFVKMVHNGIEYGDMQIIAEAYYLLRHVGGKELGELSEIFARWNSGPLSSFLIEITARVLSRKDEATGKPLVDLIVDSAGQKGTGRWTVQVALDLGVPAPTIAASVDARAMSSLKKERLAASEIFDGAFAKSGNGASGATQARTEPKPDRNGDFVNLVHDALYASKIICYAQGMAIIAAASVEWKWDLNLRAIAAVWRGGCIIRARFLAEICAAFDKNPHLPNLLLDPQLTSTLVGTIPALRAVVSAAAEGGVPCPAMAAALGYFESYRTAVLPQNLTQGQRDLFGAHTFERLDKPGVFHVEW